MTAELYAALRREYLLLDFDGPICAVFSSLSSRNAAEELASKISMPLPTTIANTHDPFEILRYSARHGNDWAQFANHAFTAIEIRAVHCATPNFAGHAVIRQASRAGKKIAVVSNNSTECIDQYMRLYGLHRHICGIYARTSSDIDKLKPNPHLLQQAITGMDTSPKECVFLGDSLADIQAGHAIFVPVVAFANHPKKIPRFLPHHPTAIVTSMNEVKHALGYRWSDKVGM